MYFVQFPSPEKVFAFAQAVQKKWVLDVVIHLNHPEMPDVANLFFATIEHPAEDAPAHLGRKPLGMKAWEELRKKKQEREAKLDHLAQQFGGRFAGY